jgi:primosomal protein N'
MSIKKTCPDCGVNPGELHEDNCDVARCKNCGWQLLFHDNCDDPENTTWTGEWPGVAECKEFDLWSYFGPPWIVCKADHPQAVEDLNTLLVMAVKGEVIWDRGKERFVKPQ